MSLIYDATAPDDDVSFPLDGRPSPRAALSDLPDVYLPRRRRVPLLVVTAVAFGSVTALFYGGEALLPPPYKPSVFVGGYGKEIEKARKAGELDSQVRYDAQVKGIEVQFQTKLKTIETSAIQLQDQCRAGFQNATNLYQAAYQRANNFAQATADLQKEYANTRYNLAAQTVGGEIGAANTATGLGYILGFLDTGLGQKAMEFAEEARQQALAKLDAAAQHGITVSVDGWNTGLPNPASLAPLAKCELPVIASGETPPPITVPELPALPAKEG